MAISELVPALEVYEISTIDQAITQLREGKISFGVITSNRKEFLKVVSMEELTAVEDKARLLRTLVPRDAEPIIVDSPETLDEVVQNYAKKLELRPNLPGIVVMEKGELSGVLPRHIVVRQAKRVVTRSSSMVRIEGSPLDALFFKCPIDNERKMVNYYDPTEPPLCSNRHLMVPDE